MVLGHREMQLNASGVNLNPLLHIGRPSEVHPKEFAGRAEMLHVEIPVLGSHVMKGLIVRGLPI